MFNTNLHAPWYNDDDMSFSPYAKHTQEVEDIITMIGNGYTDNIECDNDISIEDMRHIESEVYKRYGISVDLT